MAAAVLRCAAAAALPAETVVRLWLFSWLCTGAFYHCVELVRSRAAAQLRFAAACYRVGQRPVLTAGWWHAECRGVSSLHYLLSQINVMGCGPCFRALVRQQRPPRRSAPLSCHECLRGMTHAAFFFLALMLSGGPPLARRSCKGRSSS